MVGISSGADAPAGVMVSRPSCRASGSRGDSHVRMVTALGLLLVTLTVMAGGEPDWEEEEEEGD